MANTEPLLEVNDLKVTLRNGVEIVRGVAITRGDESDEGRVALGEG